MLSFAEGPVLLAIDAEVGAGADPFVTGAAEGMIPRVEEFLNLQKFETTRTIKAPGEQRKLKLVGLGDVRTD